METALLLAGKITELTLIVLMGMALVKSKLLNSEQIGRASCRERVSSPV